MAARHITARAAAIAGLLLLMAGCHPQSRLTQENLDKLHAEMSVADAKAILGEPAESKSEPIPIVGGTKTTYLYHDDDDDEITLIFKNDSLQSKEGHFGHAAR